jgi:ferredoxin-NADP reductase
VARAAVLGRLTWHVVTVGSVVRESERAVTMTLESEERIAHRPGQHVDVRLTAEDGYQAERSYSIASAPDDPSVSLTVEQIPDGEVSPWLTTVAEPGDQFEVRGPVGGYFVWDDSDPAPVLLVGGGSGVVPLMSMVRHRGRRGIRTRMRLLYSARSEQDLLYREELDGIAGGGDGFDVVYTLTREAPPEWAGYRRRIDARMLAEVGLAGQATSTVFVCGPTPFVEAAAKSLVLLGHEPARVKTERFGPSGGGS